MLLVNLNFKQFVWGIFYYDRLIEILRLRFLAAF